MTVVVNQNDTVLVIAQSQNSLIVGAGIQGLTGAATNVTGITGFTNGSGFTGNVTDNNLSIVLQYANGTQDGQITSTNYTDWQNKITGTSNITDNAIVRFDGTTGKLAQGSTVLIDDNANASGIMSMQFADGVNQTLAAGKFWYNNTTGSFNLGMGNGNITQQIGEELFCYGKASSAINDSVLQLVYKTGTVGASGVIEFAPAIAGITASNLMMGVSTEAIALNGFGRVTTFGIVHGIDTTGSDFSETWADNDIIWYNPTTGGLTKTKPIAPNLKFQVGTVIRAGVNGDFLVEMIHGSSLGELDNNVELSNLTTGDIITYNGNLARFENRQLVAGSNINISASTTGNITITANETGIQRFTNGSGFSGTVSNNNLSLNLQNANGTQSGQLISGDWLSFTGAVSNISTLQTDVSALNSAMRYIGEWDASTGVFPGGGTAQAGYVYSVSVAGTVDGQSFEITDRIAAIADNASISTYAGNWLKQDYTDLVTSVNGQVGAVNLTTANVSASTNKNYVTDSQLVNITNLSGTNTGDQNLSGYVQDTRTINGQNLTTNITINHSTNSGLGWTSAGHTGANLTVAGFNATGSATELSISGNGTSILSNNNADLGTPASGNLTNCNGTAAGLTAGNVTNVNVTNVTGILPVANGGVDQTSLDSWTPTYANFTLGNGTVDTKYMQLGKMVFIRVVITIGSTTSVGTAPTISLPVTSITPADTLLEIGRGWILDVGTARFPLSVSWASTATMLLSSISSANAFVTITSTAPMTWANGDKIYFQGWYEAA